MTQDDFSSEEEVINQLERDGFDRADLPGPGDLHDAIWTAGLELKERETGD
jgi:hypothetical protein